MSAKLFGEKLLRDGKKIIGIGKNYQAHAIEMGAKAAPKEPIVFLKPTTSYVRNEQPILIPKQVKDLHHEVELGVVIGKAGKDIAIEEWEHHVAGYVLAIDMTARDLQGVAKSQGLPWTNAKSFDTFCPISDFISKKDVPNWKNLELWLKVDNELRQKGATGDMVHSIPYLISYLSEIMTLEEGDVILTGTPSGVGPVLPNQVITAGITNLIEMTVPVKKRNYY